MPPAIIFFQPAPPSVMEILFRFWTGHLAVARDELILLLPLLMP